MIFSRSLAASTPVSNDGAPPSSITSEWKPSRVKPKQSAGIESAPGKFSPSHQITPSAPSPSSASAARLARTSAPSVDFSITS